MGMIQTKELPAVETRRINTQTIVFSTQVNALTYSIFLGINYTLDGKIKHVTLKTGNGSEVFRFESFWDEKRLTRWKIVNGLIERAIDYVKELNGSEVQIMKSEYNTTIHI